MAIYKRYGSDDEGIEMDLGFSVTKQNLCEFLLIDETAFVYILDESGNIIFTMKDPETEFSPPRSEVYIVKTDFDADNVADNLNSLEQLWRAKPKTVSSGMLDSVNDSHIFSIMNKLELKDAIKMVASCGRTKDIYEKYSRQFRIPIDEELIFRMNTDDCPKIALTTKNGRGYLEVDPTLNFQCLRPFLLSTIRLCDWTMIHFSFVIEKIRDNQLRFKTLKFYNCKKDDVLHTLKVLQPAKAKIFYHYYEQKTITAGDLMIIPPLKELSIFPPTVTYLTDLPYGKTLFDIIEKFNRFHANFRNSSVSSCDIISSYLKAFSQNKNLGNNKVTVFSFSLQTICYLPIFDNSKLEKFRLDVEQITPRLRLIWNQNGEKVLFLTESSHRTQFSLFGLLENDTEEGRRRRIKELYDIMDYYFPRINQPF